MVSHLLFRATFSSLLFLSFFFHCRPQFSKSDDNGDESMPSFAFSWLDDVDIFVAGDVATIKVKVLGKFETSKYKHPFSPNITVNDKMGNSSYITGVSSKFDGDLNDWRISFMPIMVGLSNVLITDHNFNVFDSSLHFQVTPGRMYAPGGIVSWMGQASDFMAGTKATVMVLPKDAFGNNVTSTSEGNNVYNFTVSASYVNGSDASVLFVVNRGWNEFDYLSIEFVAATAGSLFLHIGEKNQTLIGSPLPFNVYPGALDVSNCVPQWNVETKSFQIFSVMEIFINQRDKYGNLVPGFYAFDVEVVEKGTNLSMPITDLQFKEVLPGIQSSSFSLVEPGDFSLIISHKGRNNLIFNMPYDFTVYVGYCDGDNSIVNGSGLNNSVAGTVSKFSIFLKDAYQYPSPVELGRLQVEILSSLYSLRVYPHIFPKDSLNGTQPIGNQSCGALGSLGIASDPSVDTKDNSPCKEMSSSFDVLYTPEKSGVYKLRIFCGNIPLNGGLPFVKEVSAGDVNASISGVVKFAPKVAKLIRNEIVVQLMDSFANPVLLQESKLKLEIASINRSGFSTFGFVDKSDGMYTGSYLTKDVGTYEICASFNRTRFLPCPFGVNVYSGEYFPKAYNDTVFVWEDESTDFSVLSNDYFAGHNASIVEHQKPGHGSLLQYENLFRYTPYKGFYGNDSFTYTISDVNGNFASGVVSIFVRCIPPQFVSFPSQLQATEDIISPKFGGFRRFEIMYSDSMENISVTLSAQSGTVFLSPLLMQFWEPIWNELSVSEVDGVPEDLQLVGRLEVINFALQSILYIGHENFYGTDAIQLSTINRNGKNNLEIPILVEPINDPPSINVPESIILENMKHEGGVLIFDRTRDKFEFSIGDPDFFHFPGNDSHFLVMFSVEVNSGFLSTNLPAELIRATELKLKNSYQWQPLQTFVTISKHFTVNAKGIRFRGSINDCNNVMQQLSYHGGEHGGLLTVRVNDMGWYGNYPDSTELMSVPLFMEANVNLIGSRPMSPLLAHTLGAAIVIEFIVMSSLGVLLLFFICKCAIVLIHEKRKHQGQPWATQLYRLRSSHKQMSSTDLSENVIHFTGCCPSGLPSNFCKQACHNSGTEELMDDSQSSSLSSGDEHLLAPQPGIVAVGVAETNSLSHQCRAE